MASMSASSASTGAVGELASVKCLYVWLLASSGTCKHKALNAHDKSKVEDTAVVCSGTVPALSRQQTALSKLRRI